MVLGSHMSIAGGFHKAPERGRQATCDAIQIFTKNNMQWNARPITREDGVLFQDACREQQIEAAFGHTSYLINLGATDDQTARKSLTALQEEIDRAEVLGLPFLVLHPGGHMGRGEQAGLKLIAQRLTQVLKQTDGCPVKIALETTAGQGSQLGYRFEQLAGMIERCRTPERLGICLDTAHLFAAGYDIRTPEGYQEMKAEMFRLLDRNHLLAVHLNDSKTGLDSRVDRHAHIGEGELGLEAFRAVVNDPDLQGLPLILETPKGKGPDEDVENLRRLRSLLEEDGA